MGSASDNKRIAKEAALDSVDDIWKMARAQDALLEKQVYLSNGRIVVNVEYPYEIEIARCDSHAKILAWLVQLSEKTWISPAVMRRFAWLAAKEHGLEIILP